MGAPIRRWDRCFAQIPRGAPRGGGLGLEAGGFAGAAGGLVGAPGDGAGPGGQTGGHSFGPFFGGGGFRGRLWAEGLVGAGGFLRDSQRLAGRIFALRLLWSRDRPESSVHTRCWT